MHGFRHVLKFRFYWISHAAHLLHLCNSKETVELTKLWLHSSLHLRNVANPWPNNALDSFFTNNPQMGLSAQARICLGQEGLAAVDDFEGFK